ncbi:hypothetical protein [Isobaculum melis]|uniref:Uncharacterized protein n=1 Tax=Isobaculum melis TaxID=142588 RepID=A0A1H9T0R7_9LACT|nr:hypothetical protein [Isobaculum melis]SER90329.1 hypothetical protein SAMN04488559_11017 [Isobaculum melis]
MTDIYTFCDQELPKLVTAISLMQNKQYEDCNELVSALYENFQDNFATTIPKIYLNKFQYRHWENLVLKNLIELLEKLEFLLVKNNAISKNIVMAYFEGASESIREDQHEPIAAEKAIILVVKGLIYAYSA